MIIVVLAVSYLCVLCVRRPFPVVGLEVFGAFTVLFLGPPQQWREVLQLISERIH